MTATPLARLMLLAGTLLVPLHARAVEECRAASREAPAALLELYTSEGCSSCPPADRWLSALPAGAAIVPLALHVDYWDSLGWKDPYAHPDHARRQREAVGRSGARVVYTPQVMLNGRDFPGWRSSGGLERALRGLAGRQASVSLELQARPVGDGSWQLQLMGAGPPDVRARVVLTEDGLSSDVRAGENRGTRLRHDHVLRSWLGGTSSGKDGSIAWQYALRPGPGVDSRRARVVAFAEDASGTVLQAVSLPLCGAPG